MSIIFLKMLRMMTRILYKYPHIWKIAEAIRKNRAKESKILLINDFDGNLSFFCDLSEHMGSQIFWRGFYSDSILSLIDRLLAPDMVFIDVGANHGEFTVFAAKRLTEGQVIAFEPVSVLFKKLERNVSVNGFKNVILIQKGLGDREQELPIYTAKNCFNDGTKHEGLPTMYQTSERSEIYEKIRVIRLDDFVENQKIYKIHLIKIDVEGAELVVLEGARETIKKFRPIVIVEVNGETSKAAGYDSRALLDYLAELGYHFELISQNGTKPILPEQLSDFQNVVCWP